ncbi:glycosyltransferase [candidate division WOR-3 bacterium]|nr:glycosyltransferase [candidate division WOR-3 bacterium]
MKKIKILFILDVLEFGGAQRVSLNILRFLNRSRFTPLLTLLKGKGNYIKMLPQDVTAYNLNLKRARFGVFDLVRILKITRPHIVFSTVNYIDEVVNVALRIYAGSYKLILRSPNFPSQNIHKYPVYVRLISRWSYNKADMVIASTKAMKSDLQLIFDLPLEKVKLVHNPVDLQLISSLSKKSVEEKLFHTEGDNYRPVIVSMGRLTEQKGFTYLIRAFKMVQNELPSKLVIIGDGAQKRDLENLTESLGIAEDVIFLGLQSNPYKYLANSDLFVLSSLWEGFPNSLVEAMTCGIPVISTDCPSGPKEIITNGENGLLVPPKDYQALVNSILQVLTNKKLASNLAESGLERVKDFEVKMITKKYEQLFLSVLENTL